MQTADAKTAKDQNKEAGESVSQEAIQWVQISLAGAVRWPTHAVAD